jgi:ATP-dependent protease HslVU (ClpYQ) peptidase subunit
MIVVVRKNGMACIGADDLSISGGSRKCSSNHITNTEKIIQVGDSFLGAESDPALPLVLATYFHSKKSNPRFSSLNGIFEELLVMHQDLKEQYFLQPDSDEGGSFESIGFQMLIANPNGIFGTYSQRSVQEYTRFYAIGSGSNYALGALDALYERLDSAEDLLKAALKTAREFDIEVGELGQLYTVALK